MLSQVRESRETDVYAKCYNIISVLIKIIAIVGVVIAYPEKCDIGRAGDDPPDWIYTTFKSELGPGWYYLRYSVLLGNIPGWIINIMIPAPDLLRRDAHYYLGYSYERGSERVAEDKEKAVWWYTKAAEQGHSGAQNNLGACYEHGDGVGKNKKKAVKWYRRAADQGHSGAQNNLGSCYERGKGVEEDSCCSDRKKKAVKWYTKAAKQGHIGAQRNLAACYEEGKGVEVDLEMAAEWRAKAEEQSNEQDLEQDPEQGYAPMDIIVQGIPSATDSGLRVPPWLQRGGANVLPPEPEVPAGPEEHG